MNNVRQYFFVIFLCLFIAVPVFLRIVKIQKERGQTSDGKNIIRNTNPYAELGGKKVFIEIADTEEKRIKGLSGRDALAENHGMLFLFPDAGFPVFWMKDMRFPIDIIWIRDKKIVDITAKAPPQPGARDQDLKIYVSRGKVNFVLEVASGFAENHTLHIGDSVRVVVP